MSAMKFYEYRCQCLRVHDADTVRLDIDLGFGQYIKRYVQMWGMRASSDRAKRRLLELIQQAGDDLCCRTHKDQQDEFGRYFVSLYASPSAETSFNDILITEGLANPFIEEGQ